MKDYVMRCRSCHEQYMFTVPRDSRLDLVIEKLCCPHCGVYRNVRNNVAGRRCERCGTVESLLVSFKSEKYAPIKLVKGLCAACYRMGRRRMNKIEANAHTSLNEAQ